MTIETANRLHELRKKHNLSQEELAEKLGVSRQAVSKWERNEASPDTDNLILLAKIYNLSLDELVFGKASVQNNEQINEDTDEQEPCEEKTESKGTNTVNIGPTGIYVESDDGDKVQINLKGIKITEGERSKYDNSGVKINLGGLKIGADSSIDLDDDDDFDDDDKELIEKSGGKARFWLSIPYPIICTILYLLFGCLNICGGWAKSWIVFITIPIYYSLIDAISKKRFANFTYPVFTAFAYLFMGLYLENWHPSWLIFVTIPAYYSIINHIDKKIKHRKNKRQSNKNNIVL